MITTSRSSDIQEYLQSGRALLISDSDVVKITKDENHFFYYTTHTSLQKIIKEFLCLDESSDTAIIAKPKEVRRVKIEVASKIDGRDLTQAEQTLLKVRERFNFFKSMDDAEVLSVAKDIGMLRLNKGETLFKQGSDGDEVFFIVRGVVSIQIAKNQTLRVEVAKLHAGAIFGEISPVTKERRSATVICIEDNTTLLSFRLSEEITVATAMAYAKLYHNFTFILAEKILNQNRILAGSNK